MDFNPVPSEKTTESTKMNELNYKTRVMVRINARE